MPNVDLYNLEHKKVGSLSLSDEVFGVEPNAAVVWEVVKAQMARRRRGTAATKTRGAVSGTGKKPYGQKHTGRARQGTMRAPHHRKGGVAFGPHPRSYAYQVPRKVRRLALRSVLSQQAREGRLVVVDDFRLPQVKTKVLAQILSKFGLERGLLVDAAENLNLKKSARNLASFLFRRVEAINLIELMRYGTLMISKQGVEKLEEGLRS
ncbi:MAG: 50S ribosomal protein L4 [Myxococcales bacterium]|nr:50S ribosomal protein L4 [Myxococcales bacterium]